MRNHRNKKAPIEKKQSQSDATLSETLAVFLQENIKSKDVQENKEEKADRKNEQLTASNLESVTEDNSRVILSRSSNKDALENAKAVLISELLKRFNRHLELLFEKASVRISSENYYKILILLIKCDDTKSFIESFYILFPELAGRFEFSLTDYRKMKREAKYYNGIVEMLYRVDSSEEGWER